MRLFRTTSSIGKVVFFEFEATLKMELFGVKKTLPCFCYPSLYTPTFDTEPINIAREDFYPTSKEQKAQKPCGCRVSEPFAVKKNSTQIVSNSEWRFVE